MRRMRNCTALLAVLALAMGAAYADDDDRGQGHMMGPGMMGGSGMMGPGTGPQAPRGSSRPGWSGYGSGMNRMGPGMMGQGMQGYYGPGMGRPGYGQGMGSPTPWGADLNLSEEQSRAISKILQQTRAKHLQTQGQMMEAINALQEAYDRPRPDPEAVGEAYEEVLRYQKEMAVDNVESQNRIYEVLNEEQREQLRRQPYRGPRW